MELTPTHCRFDHPGFATLGSGIFRLTKDDKVAALAVQMGGSDVVVPLRAVARLFGIKPDSPDGKMLGLVEQGLRFVPQLRFGDKLPKEVLTGEASWEPLPYHLQTATAKLQLQLMNWISGAADLDEGRITGQMLIDSMEDPSIRPRVQDALRRAATTLGIEGGPSAVSSLIEELARELSYIEALREWLLDRARAMLKRLLLTSQDLVALAPSRRETLFQVMRLASTAVIELTIKFEEVDAQSSEIASALRNLEQHRSFLRPHRDQIYSSMLAWEPVLAAWDSLTRISSKEPEGVWRVIDETYRFLAPRYMPVQAWQNLAAQPDKAERAKSALLW